MIIKIRTTLAILWILLISTKAGTLSFYVSSEAEASLPCRIHLVDAEGNAHHPPSALFWRGGFICDGKASLELPSGVYRYEIEKGPEWSADTGEVEVSDKATEVRVRLKRIVDLKKEGWFGGDLHVHRKPNELPQHLEAEDLSIASVQTWWRTANPWSEFTPPNPIKEHNGRLYHILSGEDERGGGALLFHRMTQTIDITKAEYEWPSPVTFLHRAKQVGSWVEIEKPFWLDTPLWLSTGQAESVGLAHNHMQRSGVLGTEAWGRARDKQQYPGVHGNGLYTQDLYYKILNVGIRLPPSAGSASGVLPNPVGYNRVYVHAGDKLDWDQWWAGLRHGRSFVTNGPLLRLTANERLPGEILQNQGPLEVTIAGRLDSRDPIKKIELVQNGIIREITLPAKITIERSGWFLVRVIADVDETFRFASTAPWYVEIDGKRMVLNSEAATFFLKWAVERKANVEQALKDNEAQRREVAEVHDKAIVYWNRVLSQANE